MDGSARLRSVWILHSKNSNWSLWQSSVRCSISKPISTLRYRMMPQRTCGRFEMWWKVSRHSSLHRELGPLKDSLDEPRGDYRLRDCVAPGIGSRFRVAARMPRAVQHRTVDATQVR